MAGSTYARIVNSWIHDFASGTWAACVLVMWVLAARVPGLPTAAGVAIVDAVRLLFGLLLASLVVILATGGIRLRYWRSQGTPDELPQRRRALLAKHVAYFVVYGAGTVWAWYLLRTAAGAIVIAK